MPPPQALLIDLDGVIRRWPAVDIAVEHAFGLAAGTLHRTAFAPPLLGQVLRGRIDDGEWRRRVADALAPLLGVPAARAAVAAWSEPVGAVDAATLHVLGQLGAGVRCVLVTNATSRLAHDLAALGLDGRFDAVVNSSEVGHAKPEAALFRHALAVAGVAPEQALFVDDTLANCAAARALGMRSHVFSHADGMRAFLAQTGALRASA